MALRRSSQRLHQDWQKLDGTSEGPLHKAQASEETGAYNVLFYDRGNGRTRAVVIAAPFCQRRFGGAVYNRQISQRQPTTTHRRWNIAENISDPDRYRTLDTAKSLSSAPETIRLLASGVCRLRPTSARRAVHDDQCVGTFLSACGRDLLE
jgi:hypothetical protein